MEEVLLILQNQIQLYGGHYGIRDTALLSSALAMPEATFEGKYLHSDLFEQAAAYAYHICENHPFIDGNKRTALAAALVFLDLNGYQVHDPEERLYALMIGVASGKLRKQDMVELFRTLAKKISRKHHGSRTAGEFSES